VHPQPHAGDHAEHPFGADEQLPQIGAGRRSRRPADVQDAGRGDGAQPAHHVVEPPVTRRTLTRRPGGGEATDGGVAEALGEVAEGEAAFAEQPFGIRAGDPGAEFGLARHLVEPVQRVEAAQIQRHHGGEVAADRVQPAHDAGPPAERHHRDALRAAVLEDRRDLLLVGGQQYRVGCVLNSAIAPTQQVEGGLAARVQQPAEVVGHTIGLPDDAGQRGAIGVRQGRRAKAHLFSEERRAWLRDAERLFQK